VTPDLHSFPTRRSSDLNFKITSAADIDRAERMLMQSGETRTGMGYDVHSFGPGDHVWLCGVQIPHDAGLVGHSDADAGLHALTRSEEHTSELQSRENLV